MKHQLLAASALSTAVGLALAMQAPPVHAQSKAKEQAKMEHCYGINAVAKNDCAEGAHSCAGQATQARDTKSFVLVPVGACAKIEGGKLKST